MPALHCPGLRYVPPLSEPFWTSLDLGHNKGPVAGDSLYKQTTRIVLHKCRSIATSQLLLVLPVWYSLGGFGKLSMPCD